MLSEDKNRLLTSVGAGTPMGEVLRRHWHPIAGVDELEREAIKPVRLMGEDTVLYKDLSGDYGPVARHCAHRRADLAYGYVEQHGLRCNYHGWCYDARGRCIEQPFEEVADPAAGCASVFASRPTTSQPRPACCGLTGTGSCATTAGLGALQLGQWLRRWCSPMFPATGCKHRRTRSTRYTLNGCTPTGGDNCAARPGGARRATCGSASKNRTRLPLQAHQRRYRRAASPVDHRPGLPVAERLLPRRSLRVAGAGGRHQHAERHRSFIRVPREAEPFVQRTIPSWKSPTRDPATGRWISSHVINRTSSPGSDKAGHRPHAREPGCQRQRHRHDPPALV